jgi:hypothetical protein
MHVNNINLVTLQKVSNFIFILSIFSIFSTLQKSPLFSWKPWNAECQYITKVKIEMCRSYRHHNKRDAGVCVLNCTCSIVYIYTHSDFYMDNISFSIPKKPTKLETQLQAHTYHICLGSFIKYNLVTEAKITTLRNRAVLKTWLGSRTPNRSFDVCLYTYCNFCDT